MKLKVADKEQEVLIKNLTEDLKQSQMEITRMKEEEKNYKQLTKNLKAHLNSLNKPNRSALRKVINITSQAFKRIHKEIKNERGGKEAHTINQTGAH